MRLFAICAVLAGSLVGFGAAAGPASATVCARVIAEGEWFSPTAVGQCPDPNTPPPGTMCIWEQPGAYPQFYVYTEACAPDPVTQP